MEITFHNGKTAMENGYITTEKHSIKTLLLDGRAVDIEDLPKLNTKEETDLRYINYGAKTFVIYKDLREKLEYFFMYEQELKHNKMRVKDYMMTTIIPEDNHLYYLVDRYKYILSHDVSCVLKLKDLLEHINYVLNPQSIVNQISEFILPQEFGGSKKEETKEEKSLVEVAKETGIPYKTLWGRTKVRGMSVEEAVAKGYKKGKPAVKRKHPEVTYNGKNLKELSEEYNIPYQKLWCRLHKHNWTIERALGIEKVGEDNE